MALDEMNNAMPPEELKEMNEKNGEENGELITLRGSRRKILELHQQNLDELLTNELTHDEPP